VRVADFRFAAAILGFVLLGLPGPGEPRPGSGMPEIAVVSLPREARQTLQLIRQGGTFPYRKDGSVFGNRERLLPARVRGYYREYTVKTPGARDRGARRIVAGGCPSPEAAIRHDEARSRVMPPCNSGEYYYTEDHYASFRRIRE